MKLLNPGLLQSLYQLNHQGSYIFIEPVPIWSEMNSLFFFFFFFSICAAETSTWIHFLPCFIRVRYFLGRLDWNWISVNGIMFFIIKETHRKSFKKWIITAFVYSVNPLVMCSFVWLEMDMWKAFLPPYLSTCCQLVNIQGRLTPELSSKIKLWKQFKPLPASKPT